MPIVLATPPQVANMIQQGALERAFHDGLFPQLHYRAEALVDEWQGNTGQEIFESRPGILAPVTTPLVPGNDPVPVAVSYEQWLARLERYGNSIDTHMPTASVANANLWLRNIHQLGLNAGQTLNRVPRNALFTKYLQGQTCLTAATAAIDLVIQVASLNGFVDVVTAATSRPVPVSPANPLQITIETAVPFTRNVIAATPNDPAVPLGPGTLTLSAAVGAVVPIRTAVRAFDRPDIIRSGGGVSVDAIAAGDIAVLQDFINATNILRAHNVPEHEDGYYHAHISPAVSGQLFADAPIQRALTALPDHPFYKKGFIGEIAGILFFVNTESPTNLNAGATIATGATSLFSTDVAAETVNSLGVRVGRTIVTGKGALYERYLNEAQYVTEAGITGKIGEFDIVNAGQVIDIERVRLIMRAPMNRLQDVVSSTWSATTCFPVPSDILSGTGNQRFKRAVVIESSLGT